MNIDNAKKFIHEHQDQIVNLFITYQMIEMLLFLKLHLPGLPEVDDREDALDEVNKEMNSKTFGKLKNKYLEKFPDDDYDIKFDIETVALQRNSFMHSLWVVIALGQDTKKIAGVGEVLLNDFEKQANGLLDKIYKIPN